MSIYAPFGVTHLSPGGKLKNGAIAIAWEWCEPEGGYVLAIQSGAYVTWHIDHEGNTTSGHYFNTLRRAYLNWRKRCGKEEI